MDREQRKAQERYEDTANNPPADRRGAPANLKPGSHSTGGRKDHALEGEGEPATGANPKRDGEGADARQGN
jgi:hypothetical protein